MAETTTTESIVRQAPFLEDFQKRILEASFGRGETPVDIPAIQVAGLDPLTQQAITTGQGIGQFQPYLTTGAETIGTGLAALQERAAGAPALFTQAGQEALGTRGMYDPTSAAAFMDPYQQAVTQDALAEMQRQADIQQNQLSAQAVGSGAFGGSRQGIAQAELGRNLADMQGRRVFEDLSRNYNQAQNAAQTAFADQQRRQQGVASLLGQLGATQSQEAARFGAGIGAFGTQQASLASAGQGLIGQQSQLLSQLGSVGQTQAQRELDAARQTSLQQAYEPFQRVSFMSDIFKPQIGSAGTTLGTAVAPSPSPFSQAIGAGIAGLSANRYLGNPFGGFLKNYFSDTA
tara:strand:- start:1646 stop:2686 length:1041 start_codon:yes stop_codon:yes gene_type:complete